MPVSRPIAKPTRVLNSSTTDVDEQHDAGDLLELVQDLCGSLWLYLVAGKTGTTETWT